jgi:hypothetical protein
MEDDRTRPHKGYDNLDIFHSVAHELHPDELHNIEFFVSGRVQQPYKYISPTKRLIHMKNAALRHQLEKKRNCVEDGPAGKGMSYITSVDKSYLVTT